LTYNGLILEKIAPSLTYNMKRTTILKLSNK
jgi:hypothetical protein